MDFIKEIMKKVNLEQKEKYQKVLSEKKEISRKFFLSVYLNSFLGNYLSPDMDHFDSRCHKLINSISLCSEEIDFFHQIVDHKFTETYIDDLIKIYHNIEDLEKCQLGESILDLLNVSKESKFVEEDENDKKRKVEGEKGVNSSLKKGKKEESEEEDSSDD
eukprot:TRINITY_DN1378_c0_g1_i1.p1 TRINITY_DN1378_c0_g1~~TRINITY_DN1378_c0_g1_i1.p1  ORF type:complete len:161 (-),score=51.49 TRINITY_DN1378_c0_g1_i1:48-530(-)